MLYQLSSFLSGTYAVPVAQLKTYFRHLWLKLGLLHMPYLFLRFYCFLHIPTYLKFIYRTINQARFAASAENWTQLLVITSAAFIAQLVAGGHTDVASTTRLAKLAREETANQIPTRSVARTAVIGSTRPALPDTSKTNIRKSTRRESPKMTHRLAVPSSLRSRRTSRKSSPRWKRTSTTSNPMPRRISPTSSPMTRWSPRRRWRMLLKAARNVPELLSSLKNRCHRRSQQGRSPRRVRHCGLKKNLLLMLHLHLVWKTMMTNLLHRSRLHLKLVQNRQMMRNLLLRSHLHLDNPFGRTASW